MQEHTLKQRKILRPLGLALLGVFVCMLSLSAASAGATLNDFSAFNFLDNREINTQDMRGSIIVMMFGSIYCKPCVELLPVMHDLQERYRHCDVRVLLLDIDMAVERALQREFVQRHTITNTYIINAHQIAKDNKVYMLPTTLIVNRDGEVVRRIYGFRKLKTFESALKKLGPAAVVPESDTAHDHHEQHH